MNQIRIVPNNASIVIKDASGQPVTTSLAIAEGTHVQHKNVMELVRKYIADLRGFGEVALLTRLNAQGSDTEYAVLNEHQASLIIAYMRNSAIVRSFKIALVRGFFEMRAALTAPADPFAHIPPHHRALVELMCENANLKAAQEAQAIIQTAQAESIHRIEVKQCAFEEGHSFFTGLAFCAMRGVKLVMSDMQRLGKLAATYSKENNIPIDKVKDNRFGFVNSYHETALEVAFAEIHGGM